MKINERKELAANFLTYFPGREIYVSKADRNDHNGKKLGKIEKNPWHVYGKFEDVFDKLNDANRMKRGIFFTVNDLNRDLDRGRKRTARMWTRSRAIWVEDDKVREDGHRKMWPIDPNLIVNTSPGKYHYYWLTDTKDYEAWLRVQDGMVIKHGSDPAVKDLARIMRLPGFYHHKKDPFLVTCILNHQKEYKWDDIIKAFPPEVTYSTAGELKKDGTPKQRSTVKSRQFIRHDPILIRLKEESMLVNELEKGCFEIICPWVKEHTDGDETGTRYFQPYYNGFDKANFKCNHSHCESKKIKDLVKFLGIQRGAEIPKEVRKNLDRIRSGKPKYPLGFMEKWPHPWPLIFENWKRMPRELNEPLLVPTILALHSYILNGKYVTEWGRRPNLYQLNLAESTANKDTNSKDVLRMINFTLEERGINNSIFNMDLFNSDSNITSDTAFLKAVEQGKGNFFWINTEATRVFHQLYSSGNNSSVMALSDKMIEVVDGHDITNKVKANERISGNMNPNIQILFYAQPETIERFIDESMIDSGFLGRAIITLDDKKLTTNNLKMFKRRDDKLCRIDDSLAEFYASRKIEVGIGSPKIVATPTHEDLHKLNLWAEEVIYPMIQASTLDVMHKMLSRIGNTAEQLYALVLGVCREWDIFECKEPRDYIDIDCMLPILEFWAKSKEYVVREYVVIDSDPLGKAVEEVIGRILIGHFKFANNYDKRLSRDEGLVPRSMLMRVLRTQKFIRKRMEKVGHGRQNFDIVWKLNQIIDTLIKNEILYEETRFRPSADKGIKFVGFFKHQNKDLIHRPQDFDYNQEKAKD